MPDSYESHVWTSGETITAELLNHMEEGIQAAHAAQSNDELRAAFNMLSSITLAAIRRLDERVTALES